MIEGIKEVLMECLLAWKIVVVPWWKMVGEEKIGKTCENKGCDEKYLSAVFNCSIEIICVFDRRELLKRHL